MESLAALSLACNVVQLIQFSSHTVHVCKQIYENESPAADVDDDCKDLQALSTKVKASITAASNRSSQPPAADGGSVSSDQQLLSIANKLITIANDLNTELTKCRPASQDSKRRKTMKGVKYQWSGRSRIAELHNSLKNLENTMQSFVLVDIRYE
jgi:hypothetical protein